jgi:hypothetical protein
MKLHKCSEEEILKEIEKRELLKLQKPKLKKKPNFEGVIFLAEDIVKSIVKGKHTINSDDEAYMFKAIMGTLYGKKFFKWYDEIVKNGK